MQEILDKSSTKMDIIKKGARNQELLISPLGPFIKQKAERFFKIMAHKNYGDPLFTTQQVLNKEIHPTTFDKEMNNLLKELSLKHDKH